MSWMKAATPYLSALMGPAGQLMQGGASIASAAQGGGGGKASISKQPLNLKTRVLQDIAGRKLAAYSSYEAPSLLEWAEGGGKGSVPKLPGITPFEATALGMVSPFGGTIPYYDPLTGGPLTPDQIIAGAEEATRVTARKRIRPLRKLGKVERRITKVEGRIEDKGLTPKRERRLEHLEGRRSELLSRFGV